MILGHLVSEKSNDVSHWSVAASTPAQPAAGWGVRPADYGNELLTSCVICEYVLAMKSSGYVMTISLFPQQPLGPACRILSF